MLALIPARAHSKGILDKNWTPLMGATPVERAVTCCFAAGIEGYVSSDKASEGRWPFWVQRPQELTQDHTPMRDVIAHFLSIVPGPPDEIILLVQPTQPLREPKHLRAAVELMTSANLVASVVETETIQKLYTPSQADYLLPLAIPTERRQDGRLTYRPDGTVYAFRRNHVFTSSPLAFHAKMLIIPPEESCSLDTPLDWHIAELRLRARHDDTHRTSPILTAPTLEA